MDGGARHEGRRPSAGHGGGFFDAAYASGEAPWDIGRAQPTFVELEAIGLVRGSVLDVGCGTGDNILFFAEHGHEASGVDVVRSAIEGARAKAREREVDVTLVVGDVLHDHLFFSQFDTVIDSGFFHALSDPQRATFTEVLAGLLHPGGLYLMQCFSDRVPGTWGPRRVSQAEIRETFAGERWRVHDVLQSCFVTNTSRSPIDAWLAIVERT